MRAKIHDHLRKRRGFTYYESPNCDCGDYYIRHFDDNTNVLIEKEKCAHDGTKYVRANKCDTMIYYRRGKEVIVEHRGMFSIAREFDDWMKDLGLLSEDLPVTEKG